MLPLLFNILLRFRTRKVGLIADIKQVFLQTEVAPEHRDFLRFMWFDDIFKNHPELISLRFTRVLFGLIGSPFLLNGTVKSHLLTYVQFKDFKKFVEKLLLNLYVDHSVDSFDKLNDCLKFYKLSKSCLGLLDLTYRSGNQTNIVLKITLIQ